MQEHTRLSYSGPHFSHYIAASYCPDLSLMHAAKLSICARKRVPIAQWGKGLTVLLEKLLGNVLVHKLHAICLLEDDFNWWDKLLFEKRMMQQAVQDGRIPQECFAKNTAIVTMSFSPSNFSLIAPGPYIILPDWGNVILGTVMTMPCILPQALHSRAGGFHHQQYVCCYHLCKQCSTC